MPESEGELLSEWAATGLRIAIGRALLASPTPLSAADLELLVSTHQSNIKREAGRMASAGLISRGIRRAAPHKRGPKPEAFELSPAQRQRASRELSFVAPAGLLQQGQEVVTASIGQGHTVDLLETLREAEATARAAWVAMLGDELLVAYSGAGAAEPALELQAVLEAADIPSRRATVARVAPGHEWTRDVGKVTRAIDRARSPRRSGS
jgi:hypothetical protein